MLSAMEDYANPSSLHKAGLSAQKMLVAARRSLASAIGLRSVMPGQIVFTSGGTEANNMAIFGSVYAKKRRISNRIVSTDSEHPSVENSLKKLEADGFEVIRISTRSGQLDFDAYEKALEVAPLLVTMMMVNNETGALYDVSKAFDMAKKRAKETVTHCDAVQGFLKTEINYSALHADLISISSHKIHGPKGVGALIIDPSLIKSKQIVPTVYGGEQENGFRPGTENTVGIAGFGGAAEIGKAKFADSVRKLRELREYAVSMLLDEGFTLNLPSGKSAPHILSIQMPNIKSETVLHYLSAADICVSSGSACSSHSGKTSRALIAFGLTEREADCTIRVSMGEYNTKDDIDALVSALKKGRETLIRMR
jgi:cysteine desulfurase